MKIALLYGGKSTEHDISFRSAASVYKAINHNQHEVVLINITRNGEWLIGNEQALLSGKDLTSEGAKKVFVIPNGQFYSEDKAIENIDVVLPILHGIMGEDGTVQGLLEICDIPYVGCVLLSSAMCMDKDATKRMLTTANLKVADGITLYKHKYQEQLKEMNFKFNYPIFIKPANQGSSVGVSKVDEEQDFIKALEYGFKFDAKVLVENGIKGRELEVAVIGNNTPITSVPGEVIVNQDFYSFENKYIDEDGATISIPAELTDEQQHLVRETAVKAYEALDCKGLSRVDVFLTDDNEVIINEINTLPGFTSISMFPKLFEVTGIEYSQLIEKLLQYAIELFNENKVYKNNINF